jgi:hypothetical protein
MIYDERSTIPSMKKRSGDGVVASGDDVDVLHGVQAYWLRISRPSMSEQDTLQCPRRHECVLEKFSFDRLGSGGFPRLQHCYDWAKAFLDGSSLRRIYLRSGVDREVVENACGNTQHPVPLKSDWLRRARDVH